MKISGQQRGDDGKAYKIADKCDQQQQNFPAPEQIPVKAFFRPVQRGACIRGIARYQQQPEKQDRETKKAPNSKSHFPGAGKNGGQGKSECKYKNVAQIWQQRINRIHSDLLQRGVPAHDRRTDEGRAQPKAGPVYNTAQTKHKKAVGKHIESDAKPTQQQRECIRPFKADPGLQIRASHGKQDYGKKNDRDPKAAYSGIDLVFLFNQG